MKFMHIEYPGFLTMCIQTFIILVECVNCKLVCFVNMERADRNKPLTPEMKGRLITLYENGLSYQQIAGRLDVHVSLFSK